MSRHVLLAVAMSFLSACSGSPANHPVTETGAAVSTAPDTRPVILAFGDSLTAGHGVELQDNYPSQLQNELDKRGYRYRVVNAGISGDTTSGGVSRIEAALDFRPKVVILELGANDGLRGLPIAEAEDNLD